MALIHVNFFSDVLGMASQLEVVLPQANDTQIGIAQAEKRKKYPVLYLLHGMTDNHTTWTRNTSIERYATERGIAVVMPNGHLSWYTNMDKGFDYFDYIAKEIPMVVHRFFPQLSDDPAENFICGNSMGGYGAMLHGLSQPERFAGIASLSGAMDSYEVASKIGSDFKANLWTDIFGDIDAIPGSGHDLFAISEKLAKSGEKKPAIFMWCGFDDFLYAQNIKMKQHLEALGWDLTYTQTEGDHSWKCWDKHIQVILDWMVGVMQGGVQ